jgi:hypothetical protein
MLAIVSVLALAALTSAGEKGMVKFQGVVMSVDLKKRTMIVNEKECVWSPKTDLFDAKGSVVSYERLKPRTWVYIEGERDVRKRRIMIQKFHVLPKRIDDKEKRHYPFIN